MKLLSQIVQVKAGGEAEWVVEWAGLIGVGEQYVSEFTFTVEGCVDLNFLSILLLLIDKTVLRVCAGVKVSSKDDIV